MDKKSKQSAASIDELLRDMSGPLDSLPLAGGDCDTVRGWTRRLGRCRERVAALIHQMVEDGRAERVEGRVLRGNSYGRCKMVRSAALAKAAELEAAGK